MPPGNDDAERPLTRTTAAPICRKQSDIFCAMSGSEANASDVHEQLEVRVHALDRAEDGGQRVVGRIDEPGLVARDPQARSRVEHVVEPPVERLHAVLEHQALAQHRAHPLVVRYQVVNLQEDPLHHVEVCEHQLSLGVPFAHAGDVVHLHRDGEVTQGPVIEEVVDLRPQRRFRLAQLRVRRDGNILGLVGADVEVALGISGPLLARGVLRFGHGDSVEHRACR